MVDYNMTEAGWKYLAAENFGAHAEIVSSRVGDNAIVITIPFGRGGYVTLKAITESET